MPTPNTVAFGLGSAGEVRLNVMKFGSGQAGRLVAFAMIGISVGAIAWAGWERVVLFGRHRPLMIEYETLPRAPGEVKNHYAMFFRSDGAHVEAHSYSRDEYGPFPNIRTIELPLKKQRVAVD